MHFKLSARELEILDDRQKILAKLRESQERRNKTLKPPILVVPQDDSHLMAVIERCDDFPEPADGNEAEELVAVAVEEDDKIKVKQRSHSRHGKGVSLFEAFDKSSLTPLIRDSAQFAQMTVTGGL